MPVLLGRESHSVQLHELEINVHVVELLFIGVTLGMLMLSSPYTKLFNYLLPQVNLAHLFVN